MKNRALLTVIIALVMGFVLGFFTSSQITRLRTRDVRSISSSESFKTRTYNIINPQPEQIRKLDPIVDQYSERFDSLRQLTHKGYKELIGDYHKELQPYLTEEQYQNLENFAKNIKRKKHQKKGEN